MDETKENEKEPLLINKGQSQNVGIVRKPDSTANNRFVLYFLVTCFMFAFNMNIITISQFVYHKLEQQSTNYTQSIQHDKENETACHLNSSSNEKRLQKDSSEWLWYIGLVELGFSLVVILVLGIYSDFVGRKPLILFSMIGKALQSGIIAAIIYFNLDILYLFIAYVISGLGGSYYTFNIGFLTTVADTTKSNNERSFNIALLDLLVGIGASISPIATGYLIQLVGFLYPVLISCALSIICAFIVIICVAETNRNIESKTFSLTAAFHNFTGFYRNGSYIKGNPVWKFFLCLIGYIAAISPLAASENIQTLFLLRSPFCFLPEDIGWFQSATDFTKLVIGTSLIKVFHIFLKDESIAFLGCVSEAAYYTVLSFSSVTYMLYIAVGVGLLSILPLPMFRALASNMVDEHRQGALFANILVLEILCKLGFASAYNNLYAVTQEVMIGSTFLVMAGVCFVGAITVIPLLVSGVKREVEYSKDL